MKSTHEQISGICAKIEQYKYIQVIIFVQAHTIHRTFVQSIDLKVKSFEVSSIVEQTDTVTSWKTMIYAKFKSIQDVQGRGYSLSESL